MRGEHCKRAVFTALTPIAGIRAADVRLGAVTVEHDGSVTIDAISDAIAVAGYVVTNGAEDRRTLPVVPFPEQP
jgi:copper chaperone CopZ